VLIPELLVDFKLRTAYEKDGHARNDKRMNNVELSEGDLALAFAGVRGADNEPHPIEHPDRARFA
jgi:hypothetical protein